MKAIEFFSGIGGFAQVAGSLGVEILAAFDQDVAANHVYEANYGLRPICRNLDTIQVEEIPTADLWWMSPPCTPYTVRGAQRDISDRRARSLLQLTQLFTRLKPKALIVENVLGFAHSLMMNHLKLELKQAGYEFFELALCPTQFGVPMRRPRIFFWAIDKHYCRPSLLAPFNPSSDSAVQSESMRSLSEYLVADFDPVMCIDSRILERYGPVLNIVDPYEIGQQAICFTSGYGKCWKASGSLMRTVEGTVRRFMPREILNLLGFHKDFVLPEGISLTKQWKLVGNSLDLHSVRYSVALVINEILEKKSAEVA